MYSWGLRPAALDTGEMNGKETQSSVPRSAFPYLSRKLRGLATNWK